MDKRLKQPLNDPTHHKPRPLVERRRVALVAGASGSGKTLIAKMFANAYVHTMDNYFRGPFEKLEGDVPNWDVPTAVNFEEWITDYYKILQAIDLKSTCEIAKYEFGTQKVSKQIFDGAKYSNISWIVFEGLFALDPRLHHLADLKVFVDAPLERRVARRIIRDMKERATDVKFVLLHSYFTQLSYEKYIEPMKEYADLLIPNYEISESRFN